MRLALAAGVDELLAWPLSDGGLTDELVAQIVEAGVPVVSGFTVQARPPDPAEVRRFLDAGGSSPSARSGRTPGASATRTGSSRG